MRVKLFYFAKVREALGVDREEIDLVSSIETVADLVDFLKSRGSVWHTTFSEVSSIRMAVNQEIVEDGHAIEGLFDLYTIAQKLKKLHNSGASVTFEGYVRDFDLEQDKLDVLELEHYPGMTEKALLDIELLASQRWNLDDVYIVHRYGKLKVGEPIVGIIVFSKHRKEAFEACHFIIDFLKTDAPFWKKEITNQKSYWVEAKKLDDEEKKKWN
ncbi:MAG: molybdopterin synthase, large subunit [Pseudomonadota bacterium]